MLYLMPSCEGIFIAQSKEPHMFVWVRDRATGHRFDVPETDPRIRDGLFVLVKDKRYPASSVARRPKHCINHKKES